MKKPVIFSAVFLLLFPGYFFSGVRDVPGTHSTIQAALDACSTGDTVLVAPGHYYENLIWPKTHCIFLLSINGPEQTIIDGSTRGSVIKINTGIDNSTFIKGFTITNGSGVSNPLGDISGGGIYCTNSSPTITNNTITGNFADKGGGVACFDSSSPVISNNIINNNNASSFGGGIVIGFGSSPYIANNIISGNLSGNRGGGIAAAYYCSPHIENNNILNNRAAGEGSGIIVTRYCSALITGNKISDNRCGKQGGGIIIAHNSSATLSGNTVINNKSGMQGAGILIFSNCSVTITGNTVSENTNSERCGGGIIVAHNCSVTTVDNIITGNRAKSNGGGIDYSYNCTGSIKNNYISENISVDAYGGGIFIGWGSSVEISNNTITKNSAVNGGGICFNDCATGTTVNNCYISENKNDGIYCMVKSQPDISFNNIIGNIRSGINNADSTTIINAKNNWWGNPDGPGGFGQGTGDNVSMYVDYTPWSKQEIKSVKTKK